MVMNIMDKFRWLKKTKATRNLFFVAYINFLFFGSAIDFKYIL